MKPNCDRYQLILVALAAIAGANQNANAAYFENDYGLGVPHSTITFGEHVFPSGTTLTTEYSDFGVVFEPFAVYYPDVIYSFWPNGPAPALRGIRFTEQQTTVAFQFWTQLGSQFTVQALLAGVVVDSGTSVISNVGTYFGFRDVTFDGLSLTTNSWPAWAVDNIQLSTTAPIPEPTSFLLFGVGIAALVGVRKLRLAPANFDLIRKEPKPSAPSGTATMRQGQESSGFPLKIGLYLLFQRLGLPD